MNLSTMQPLLRSRIGSPTEQDVPNSKLTECLNLAYHDIANRYRFHKARKRCTFETVRGQPNYGIPSDLQSIFRLQIITPTHFTKLRKIGDREFSSRDDDTTQERWAQPTSYLRYRDSVELQPVPDAVYTVELFYKYDIVDLAEPTDIPGIPTSWHMGIVLMAKWYYYTDEADQPKKVSAYEDFTVWVRDKPTEIDEESVDIDSGVVVVPLDRQHLRRDFVTSD